MSSFAQLLRQRAPGRQSATALAAAAGLEEHASGPALVSGECVLAHLRGRKLTAEETCRWVAVCADADTLDEIARTDGRSTVAAAVARNRVTRAETLLWIRSEHTHTAAAVAAAGALPRQVAQLDLAEIVALASRWDLGALRGKLLADRAISDADVQAVLATDPGDFIRRELLSCPSAALWEPATVLSLTGSDLTAAAIAAGLHLRVEALVERIDGEDRSEVQLEMWRAVADSGAPEALLRRGLERYRPAPDGAPSPVLCFYMADSEHAPLDRLAELRLGDSAPHWFRARPEHGAAVVARLLTERFGDDVAAWTVAAELGANWNATAGELIELVAAVIAGPALQH